MVWGSGAGHAQKYPSSYTRCRPASTRTGVTAMNEVMPSLRERSIAVVWRCPQKGTSTRRSFQRITAERGPMRSTTTPGAAASPSRTTWPATMMKRLAGLSE